MGRLPIVIVAGFGWGDGSSIDRPWVTLGLREAIGSVS